MFTHRRGEAEGVGADEHCGGAERRGRGAHHSLLPGPGLVRIPVPCPRPCPSSGIGDHPFGFHTNAFMQKTRSGSPCVESAAADRRYHMLVQALLYPARENNSGPTNAKIWTTFLLPLGISGAKTGASASKLGAGSAWWRNGRTRGRRVCVQPCGTSVRDRNRPGLYEIDFWHTPGPLSAKVDMTLRATTFDELSRGFVGAWLLSLSPAPSCGTGCAAQPSPRSGPPPFPPRQSPPARPQRCAPLPRQPTSSTAPGPAADPARPGAL